MPHVVRSTIIDAPVDRPHVLETTAVGAAYLAGLTAGLCPPPEAFAASWRRERRFAVMRKTSLPASAQDESHYEAGL